MGPRLSLPSRTPRLPLVLQRRSTDEYSPLPYHPLNLPAVARVLVEGPKHAARLSTSVADYWSGRQGTAAALSALNDTWGGSPRSLLLDAISSSLTGSKQASQDSD